MVNGNRIERIKTAIRGMDLKQLHAAFTESPLDTPITVEPPSYLIDFAMEELDPDDSCKESALLLVVGYLLRSQINPNTAKDGGCTPLVKSVYRGNYTLALLLLSVGADPNTVDDEGHSVLTSCLDGEAPLKSSPFARHEMLELLLVCGATQVINRPGGEKGRTPLSLAKLHHNQFATNILLAYGATE